jgi:hypothetical protein
VLLADLARGTPKGYDIRRAGRAILEALRLGKLSVDGQLAAQARAGGRFSTSFSWVEKRFVVVTTRLSSGCDIASGIFPHLV